MYLLYFVLPPAAGKYNKHPLREKIKFEE